MKGGRKGHGKSGKPGRTEHDEPSPAREQAKKSRAAGPATGGLGVVEYLSSRVEQRDVPIDPFRALIFPNAVRDVRRRAGGETLLMLAGRLPHIPYIRLSKIERGEVAAKAGELRDIAMAIGVEPRALLVDVEAADFSLARWAGMRGEPMVVNREGEEMAMLLAAAFRARRASDPALSLAALQADYGLPAVIVSRIENAAKTPDRWNPQTMQAVCRLLDASSPRVLAELLRDAHERGDLDPWLERIPGAADREARTRALIARLRGELDGVKVRLSALPIVQMAVPQKVADERAMPLAPPAPVGAPPLRRLSVRGVPLPDGRIDIASGEGEVIAPHGAGPGCYALRMGRASLGAAIPARAVLIVEPDRFPVDGGLAVLREDAMVRVVTITFDRDGRMTGHSMNPPLDIPLDDVAAGDIAMVTAVLLG